jgi:hypothetical protein
VSDVPVANTLLSGGKPITPVARVRVMDDDAFEALVQVWLSKLKSKRGYLDVMKFGGSGDMGRDVIGWTTKDKCEGPWDNVQCKRLGKAFSPVDLWPELGKILWHAWRKDYSLPRSSQFLCSAGIGTTAKHYLTNPTQLREKLIENWEKHVATKIASVEVPLAGSLLDYVNAADFSVFQALAIEDVLEDIRRTAYFAEEFGAPRPPRPGIPPPPKTVQPAEAGYVDALLAVYAERRNVSNITLSELDTERRDRRHFDMCRRQFYSAEALREFARDFWPDETFHSYNKGVGDTVMPAYYSDHDSGLARVNAVLTIAATASLPANQLHFYADPRDKQGICHQLANEGDFNWVAP